MKAQPDTRTAPNLEASAARDELSFDHGGISRFNAWFFSAFRRYINHIAHHHKRAAFAGLDADVVVEIGAGAGANVGYLRPGTRLYAVEPNVHMHQRLRRTCASAGIEVTILATGAEAIPLPDATVDEVVCSLVLCTVRDPDRVLSEIRRVLRPGGRFRFVEHVAAPRAGLRRLVQRMIRRPWGYVFEGCHPGRETPDAVARAGFARVTVERRKLRRSLFWPVNTAAWGVVER